MYESKPYKSETETEIIIMKINEIGLWLNEKKKNNKK